MRECTNVAAITLYKKARPLVKPNVVFSESGSSDIFQSKKGSQLVSQDPFCL